jgi:GNAT superfamily N-acetyltransferase
MPEKIRIAPVTEGDLPNIAALAGVIWRAHYPGVISHEQIEYMLNRMYNLDVMRGELRNGISYDCLLADDTPMAFASYGPSSATELKLYKLYVHPDRQRHGLGTCLLRHVENVARARGFKVLALTVNKANAKAISAYQKNGFAIRDAIVVDIGGGFVMDDYVMAKAL